MAHGRVGIADVAGLGDPSVLALADRIAGVAREGRPPRSLRIIVGRTDGRSATIETTTPSGSPNKPLTQVQLDAKFRNCARNARRPLSAASIEAAIAAIGRLETLPDVRALLAPFAR